MDKKIAVVTGASRGIGAAIAQSMIQAGYFVVASATSENGINAIKEKLGENGTAFVLNLTDKENCVEFCKQVTEFGPVSVLVNNAGITKDTLMLRMKDDDWDSVIETNLSGTFRITKGMLKGMMKKRLVQIYVEVDRELLLPNLVEYQEADGDVTRYVFDAMEIDSEVNTSLFDVSLADDVVIEFIDASSGRS